VTTELKERIEVSWGERRKTAELRRTQRRVLRIDVKPSGDVVVYAPAGEPVEAVDEKLRRKAPWIFRELGKIESRPVVTPARHFVSGETHLFLGKAYRLSLETAECSNVSVEGGRLRITTPHAEDGAVFRDRLTVMAPPFIRRGLELPALVIRMMTKRWGSFTAGGRIVLNVDLVRASPLLIDYVICHELAHGFHHDHGKGWKDLLSTVMPDWESRKARLESVLR